ncbi:MAG: hypothetical protein IKX67_09365 [Bacteroidales bacterium]|nr:hypothetical protein [Bacteroidales bacterium]
MRLKLISYLTVLVLALLPFGAGAQDKQASQHLDPGVRLEIQGRLTQFLDNMERVYVSCKAKLPVSNDMQLTDGYLRMLNHRLRSIEQNMKSLDVRWNNYIPMQQWEISQDERLMDYVERYEMMKQEASDSLEVRKQMVAALQAFSEAQSFMARVDSTYNSMGKRAFELSLTSKTAPLLEKQKMKEQLLFASVQEKFDQAKEAEKFHLVSEKRMEALEDSYAALKNKSDTIQAMTYKPLIQRIKDYLLGLAAVAVLLMFVNMVQAKIKAAKEMRENMKKYKDTLKLNGKDDYPTI